MSASEAASGVGISEPGGLGQAEPAGTSFLVFQDGANHERVFRLAPEAMSASVGRLPSSDLVIDWDAKVSRRHARFEREDDAWTIVDDGLSSNGTFVNGMRLEGRRRLSDGDVVRFGGTTLLFRSPTPDPPPVPVGPAPVPAQPQPPGMIQVSSTQRRILEALRRLYAPGARAPGPAPEEQIADALVLSVPEVRRHLQVLYAKLDIEPVPASDGHRRLVERAEAVGLISSRMG